MMPFILFFHPRLETSFDLKVYNPYKGGFSEDDSENHSGDCAVNVSPVVCRASRNLLLIPFLINMVSIASTSLSQ